MIICNLKFVEFRLIYCFVSERRKAAGRRSKGFLYVCKGALP